MVEEGSLAIFSYRPDGAFSSEGWTGILGVQGSVGWLEGDSRAWLIGGVWCLDERIRGVWGVENVR